VIPQLELLAPFAGARVAIPALFLASERDPVLAHPGMETAILNQSTLAPRLHGTIMLPGCGHWIQQERSRPRCSTSSGSHMNEVSE
jgi:pimeloyl-ACP methyl ester carboxylesterase